jgi:hypothetical protein
MLRQMSLQICVGAVLTMTSPIFLPHQTQAKAQDNTKHGAREMTKVLAHLPLPGSAVKSRLFCRKKTASDTSTCSKRPFHRSGCNRSRKTTDHRATIKMIR